MTTSAVAAAGYVVVFVLAVVPGLPIGARLFGWRHAASWLTGALLGYGMTTLAAWTARVAFPRSAIAVVLAWGAVTAVSWLGFRRSSRHAREPWVRVPAWRTCDTRALTLVLLLVPVLTFPAFSKVNVVDAEGSLRIRAYFTADFVWHMAVVAELQKGSRLPVNPFLAPEPLHYYWTYFIVPSEGGRLTGASPQVTLTTTAVGTSVLLVGAMFIAGWTLFPRHPGAVAGAVFLTVVASSVEGLAALAYVWRETGDLSAVRDLNVDAIARGVGGLRIDGLPRAFWYVPQHAMSYAAGLTATSIAMAAGVSSRAPTIAAAGCALAVSVMLNPFVGAVFCAIHAFTVCIGESAAPRSTAILRHALAVVPVAFAVTWIAGNGMIEGAAGVLRFGFNEPASHAPVPAFLLSFGSLLVAMLPGLLRWPDGPIRIVAPSIFGIALSVALMHLLVLRVDLFWIGFRTGHLVQVLAPMVVARGLVALRARGTAALATVVALTLALGLPTTVIDAFNAQDISNDRMGPGFRWTVKITRAEQEALDWIRRRTADDAIVQMDPTVRGRETWSLIPSYAERRMAAGQPISLMHVPAYDDRSARVRQLYGSGDAREAAAIARDLGINYLYAGPAERAAYPQMAALADPAAGLVLAFDNGVAAVYEVVRAPRR